MDKKHWLIGSIVIGLIAVGGFAIPRLLEAGIMTVGWPEKNFIILTNGTYTFDQLDLEPGSYAIYAIVDKGVVDVDGTEYALNHELFARSEGEGFAGNSVLYEESPKVEIKTETMIVVRGDSTFQISFLKR
jgi:hypothetical protein